MTLDEQTEIAERLGRHYVAFGGGEYTLRDDCRALAYYDTSTQDLFILTYDEVLKIVDEMDEYEYEELMNYG